MLDLASFPVWWYTIGAKHSMIWCAGLLRTGNEWLSPGLWLKNIFVPMYGQYDIQGRLISFFIRLMQVIARGIGLLIWLAVCIVLFVCWLALPALVIYGFIRVKTS